MKVRPLPITLDAYEWTLGSVSVFGSGIRVEYTGGGDTLGFLHTPHGEVRMVPGDFVIRDLNGGLHVVSAQVFHQLYEPAPADSSDYSFEYYLSTARRHADRVVDTTDPELQDFHLARASYYTAKAELLTRRQPASSRALWELVASTALKKCERLADKFREAGLQVD